MTKMCASVQIIALRKVYTVGNSDYTNTNTVIYLKLMKDNNNYRYICHVLVLD